MKRIITLLLLTLATTFTGFAQTKSDVFNSSTELTWLGLDFTHVNFIGSATQWQDAGEITSAQLRDKYFVSWNELFVNEKEKYNVAKATNRTEVKYATDVTTTANSKSTRDYFVNDPGAFRHLDADAVAKIVKGYNFKGNKGIGMMFVVEGMSKSAERASMWVVFVDMGTKNVLFSKQMEGEAGGFGFRNYWAKPFMKVLKEVGSNFNKWGKGK